MVQTIAEKINSHKLIAIFVTVLTMVSLGTTSFASAHGNRYADYFDMEKPGDTSQCEGGGWEYKRSWHKEWNWHWGHDWGWWHYKKVWVPNWEKNGFDSYRHCIRFLSTPQPESKTQCKAEWWQLGFESRGECRAYLRLYPGGGYDG